MTLARVAARNLLRNRRRTLITLSGIAFGLACLLVFQALKVGLHEQFVASATEADTGSVQVHAAGYRPNLAGLVPIVDPGAVFAALGGAAAAPRLKAPALVLAGASSSTILVCGVDPRAEPSVTWVADRVVAGRYVRAGAGVLLGEELARSFGLGVGGEVTLLLQGALGRPVVRRFVICGLFRTGVASFDRGHAYLALPDAQVALQAPGVVTEIAVRVPQGEEERLAARLAAALPPGRYRVSTWEELVPDLVQLIELNDVTLDVLVAIVFALVALGIANTMVMALYERFRELGVLAALGTPPAGIFGLILLESLFLGAVACVAGSAVGVAVSAHLASSGLDLARFTSANPYFAAGHTVRAHLLPLHVAAANALTLATSLLAGVYPSWKASRLEPAEAMRYV